VAEELGAVSELVHLKAVYGRVLSSKEIMEERCVDLGVY
jgi:hypothetical protein